VASSNPGILVQHHNALAAVALGGAVAGAGDGLDAALFIARMHGVSPIKSFQFIASGLLGLSAFRGGLATAGLGCGIHFFVATTAALAYQLLSLRFSIFLRRPSLLGPLFGLGVFFIMHYLVVPLSAAPKQPPLHLLELLNVLFSHTIWVVLPIAFIARRCAMGAIVAVH
jgi:hypothetical protein